MTQPSCMADLVCTRRSHKSPEALMPRAGGKNLDKKNFLRLGAVSRSGCGDIRLKTPGEDDSNTLLG